MIKVVVASTRLDALVLRRAGGRKHSLNFILNAITFVVGVQNASSKPKKVKGTGIGTAHLGIEKVEGIIYCNVDAKAKHGPPPFLLRWLTIYTARF